MQSIKKILVFALWIGAASVHAQTQSDPAAAARMHLGRLAVTPAIALQNVGFDSNVFNEVENPKQDFTATVRPQLDAWLHLGHARLSMDGMVEGVYFKRYSSEQSINASSGATIDMHWNRLSAFVGGRFLSTRDRSGFEIDTRSRRIEDALTMGSNLRLSGKTSLGVRAARHTTDFAESSQAFGASLRQALNRHEDAVTALLEHNLTPLTTLVLSADIQHDTFEFSRVRDTRSVLVTPGVRFKPSGRVSGTAFVGYRKFDPIDATVPPFAGAYAAVDLAYTLRGMTRFAVRSQRDVEYSFEPTQPYYISTGVGGSIFQALSRSWGLSVRAGRQRLNYRGFSTDGIGGSRTDSVDVYGAGVLCRLRSSIQLGVNGDYQRRRSMAQLRDYEGLRVGSFITYGLGGR